MTITILPRTIDNTYRGSKIALWIFGVLLLLKTVMSVNSTFNGYTVLTTADGIPLDAYPPAAAGTIVAFFAIFALSQFVVCVLCAIALIRYRSAVPFMFALLLAEHLGRKLILQLLPVTRIGSPPASVIGYILLALMITGLALSLWPARRAQTESSPAQ